MQKDLTIICNGDSWVFGSEILDPELKKKLPPGAHPTSIDWQPENDSYRCPRIFSYYLSEISNFTTVNISWPADDNTTILRRTIDYVTTQYIAKGKSTKDIFIIVGWSSPERNSFWYDDGETSRLFRIWPNTSNFDTKQQKEFWKLYVEFLWNAQEYMSRYVYTVLELQNFCQANKINWLCFNSFQQVKHQNIDKWIDLNVREESLKLSSRLGGYSNHTSKDFKRNYNLYDLKPIWDIIDTKRFYKKDQKENTFKSYIEKNNKLDPFNGWHPSPTSHKLWAEELYRYITLNNLFELNDE